MTSIAGSNGSVKEYFGDKDFQITIKGTLASNALNVFPQEQMQIIREFCKSGQSFSVYSNVLNYYGITDIVILDYHFTQMEGDRSQVPFEINAVSDFAYQIQIQKSNQNNSQ